MENCPSQRFSYRKGLSASISQAVNKILDLRIAKSKLTQNKSVQTLSSDSQNKVSLSYERCLEGHTKDVTDSLEQVGQIEKPNHNVKEAQNPIYKIALSIHATKEERRAFNNYQDTVKQTGWSVIPVPVSDSEESAFVTVPDNPEGKVRAAAYIAESILDKALRGACNEWR